LASGIGDSYFNQNGVILHNIFFQQLQTPQADNKPFDESLQLITRVYNTFEMFQFMFKSAANTVQGSGWVGLGKLGNIFIFPNHMPSIPVSEIVLLLDLWEHAWALDYKWDKTTYIENFWQCINWTVVNQRLATP
jgi:Fe-Mn family superoxide dismutase